MAAWANSFCPDTWNYRTGLQSHLYVLQQELHTEMTQFDLDLTTYIQSTFCFVDEQTPESVALDLHYVWEGLTCLNSTLQILSSKRVRGTRLVARRILNRNKGRLNDAIEDVRTLALKAQRSTYLPHPQLTDDCSLWRNSSDYFLLLSYSFVSRSLTLSQDLMNRCS
ncbi:uncharacterized protein LOC112565139 [Pomacea canaliculata]|uniref:uncharacterized protein LOC112565139 n=1 Tax=Pomacea canaliculata TaxID=400727 RepID=UPI000D728217|nr:uncharacterized protein LOC112565139 [Pomacea canaliculata]